MLIIRVDNREDRGQLLRTRRPSHTVTLEGLYPLERIPDFYRNDGLHELIGLPHEDLLLTAQTTGSGAVARVAAAGADAVVIDHEALHPAFAPFWEDDELGRAVSEAVRGGARLWIGFQGAGYVPAWLAALLPGGIPWSITARGKADSILRAVGADGDHPLAAGLPAGEPVDWLCGESWRALRNVARTEPFDPGPQPSEYGSIAWLSLPDSGWRIVASRYGHPEQVALAEAACGKGRIALDQTLALHGANIDAAPARRFAAAVRRFLAGEGAATPSAVGPVPLDDGFFALTSATAPVYAPARIETFDGIPYCVHGEENLLAYDGPAAELPVGLACRRFFLLGGLLSWPFASGSWFVDARDFRQDFFIGDRGGRIRLVYRDGTEDVVPLVFGVTIFWQEQGFRDDGGWRPPFDDEGSRSLLLDALRLQRANGDGIAAWWLDLAPRDVPLDRLVFEREPAKIGMPVLAAATVLASDAGNAPPRSTRTLDTARPWTELEPTLLPLQRCLYTFPDRYETAPLDAPAEFEGARIRFHGPRDADALSCIYAANIHNLAGRLHPDHGTIHLDSGAGFGCYRSGNGTWREETLPADWAPNGWSRDNGRCGVERIALGMRSGCDREIALFDRHLYCGDPPHMERTLRDMRQTHQWARESLRGNRIRVAPENDGHGLVMLYRAAWMRQYPETLEALWPASRDYAEWICFLVENPVEPDQPSDTLYTVSECSGFGGWDVHSHALCRAGLAAFARLARQRGEIRLAERWEGYAARLTRALREHLVIGVPPRWRSHPASDWQSGSEALTPLLSLPDWLGYDPGVGIAEENRISRLTFDALVSGGAWWMRQRMIGYDLALVTQAALLLDDRRAARLIGALCRGIYSAHGPDPWIVSEGAIMHESGRMWYRSGRGGNLVHLAETLKVVRLMTGVDDLAPGRIRLMPRIPEAWSGITVEKYPVRDPRTNAQAHLTYTFTREKKGACLEIESPADVPLDVRLGPFAAKGGTWTATLDGRRTDASECAIDGQRWVWVRDVPGGKACVEVRAGE